MKSPGMLGGLFGGGKGAKLAEAMSAMNAPGGSLGDAGGPEGMLGSPMSGLGSGADIAGLGPVERPGRKATGGPGAARHGSKKKKGGRVTPKSGGKGRGA